MSTRFNVKIETKLPSDADIDNANALGIFAMSEQALKDSNFYCKEDQGTLIDSSHIHSRPEDGELAWVTPYAEKQYYLEGASKDPNPNAQMMWFHKAKDVHMGEWKIAYTNAFMKELKK